MNTYTKHMMVTDRHLEILRDATVIRTIRTEGPNFHGVHEVKLSYAVVASNGATYRFETVEYSDLHVAMDNAIARIEDEAAKKIQLYNVEVEFTKNGETIRAHTGTTYTSDLHAEKFEAYGKIVKETENVLVRERHGRKTYFIAREPFRTFVAADGTVRVDLSS